ncbi:transcriptional regulator, AraC family [Chthoniobacter flavus Ellin428]|uniref:Transcriptional regulator, AraC family n=1 Tax=Chthoniobacter flavus Ellin428 TaxID=497964 RepID=B4DAW8_9BACT|nr:transcriptional regulator, AraC family [Chthoniobacter flavus Ellin428]TCO84547.1 AraC-like DNA-binding protein [Chthoniobacter flavus]
MDDNFSIQVHWFGRFAGYADWRIDRVRLTPHMVAFFFVEKSACSCELNGSALELRQGDLLIVRGGDEFEFRHDRTKPVTSLSACLSLGQGDEPNVLLQRKLPRRVRWKEPKAYGEEFEKVMAALEESGRPGGALRASGAVLQWLGSILAGLRAPLLGGGEAMRGRTALDRVLHSQRWASERLSEVIMLEQWAASVGMQPVYFGRVFKSETGQPPMAWLNERRLQLSRRLLGQTAHPITQIAAQCGFACPFYFSRIFQKRFGQSPMRYRQAQC